MITRALVLTYLIYDDDFNLTFIRPYSVVFTKRVKYPHGIALCPTECQLSNAAYLYFSNWVLFDLKQDLNRIIYFLFIG